MSFDSKDMRNKKQDSTIYLLTINIQNHRMKFALYDNKIKDTEMKFAELDFNTQIQDNTKDSQNATLYKLNAITTIGDGLTQKYQNQSVIGSQVINNNPSGNGDITSIIRILPNAQFDTSQNRSTAPGEIDPANISISGGLFYQNNF